MTLLEFGDFQCPSCIATFPIIERVRSQLHSSLAFAFRHCPLEDVHPRARPAAEAAEAAALQGKFWEMHDRLFREGGLGRRELRAHAEAVGLDLDRFERDRRSEAVRSRIDEHASSARRSDVKGTPTLFVDGGLYGRPLDADELVETLAAAALREREEGEP